MGIQRCEPGFSNHKTSSEQAKPAKFAGGSKKHHQAIFPGSIGVQEKDSIYRGRPLNFERKLVSAGTQEMDFKKVIRKWANSERLVKN